MANQKDHNQETTGEENRNENTSSSSEKNVDFNTSSNKSSGEEDGDDNGFFTDDDNSLQTKEEYENDKGNPPGRNEKVAPLEPDSTPTLGDKFTINSDNEDMVTLVKDDDPDSYVNEDDQAH